ncbi:exo-beta-N-acetylmuramidase NamZ family protein [Biformimicrobium ophioploci]|uniref:DUF1343 domain-containing protein n=1 Tax=Biformimicrobium ophioploci TaxID=3036711 RepID=A0ABQ6M0P7_9GAMM|nr:DUF1343 domain-containing protein [Microbulbifer sp. NKW57]GMG87918.1 DUF1343 domain-containing protein [Microbulbifer sp. NKW57]
MKKIIASVAIAVLASACAEPQVADKAVATGAEQPDQYLPQLAGKRLGLVVNQTSVVKDRHLVDFLVAQGQDVRIVFAPEHGYHGNHDAGARVDDEKIRDIEIASLYGKRKKPSPEQMARIDQLVFDMQDVGVRFYTYISTLHYVMEACAETDTPLMVLDRPNPNGDYFDGPILDPEFRSFVGMHKIPLVHGLTVAELARMINGEGWLGEGKTCELSVVKVANYRAGDRYELPVLPSPNLPNYQSVRLYPSLALFEATPISIGRGTDFPFQVIGYPGEANGAFSFTPEPKPGAAMNPKLNGEQSFGVDLRGIPAPKFSLSYILDWRDKMAVHQVELFERPGFFDKLAGTDQLREQILAGKSEAEIRESWREGLENYAKMRDKYRLYQQ